MAVAIGITFNNCAKSNLEAPKQETEVASLGYSNNFVKTCSGNSTNGKLSASKDIIRQKIDSVSAIEKVPTDLAEMSASQVNSEALIVRASGSCLRKNGAQSFLSQAIISKGIRNEMDEFTYKINLSSQKSGQELAAAAASDPCILHVDLNFQMSFEALDVPNDPLYVNQKHLPSINFEKVYGKVYNSNNGINTEVRVAVVDSGVDTDHPDLKENILKNSQGLPLAYNPMAGERIDDVSDTGYHGTHVAGLIAAKTGNSIGGSSVMGKFIKILPVKVSTDGRVIDADAAINGVRWAAEQGADVINLSLGGPRNRPAWKSALEYAVKKGAFIAIASGNGDYLGHSIQFGSPADICSVAQYGSQCHIDSYYSYPAAYGKDIQGAVTVGSIDATTGNLSFFSNYSSSYVEIASPGSDGNYGILSTVPARFLASGYARLNGNSPIQGTSMASPVVAGSAAMLIGLAKSRGYDIYPEQVEELLLSSSPTSTLLTGKIKDSKKLDLLAMVSKLEAESHVSLETTVDRKDSWGIVKIASQPIMKEVSEGATNQSLAVTLTADSSKLVSYQWYKNGRPLYGENRPSLIFETIELSDAAEYNVVVSAGSTVVQTQRVGFFVKENCN